MKALWLLLLFFGSINVGIVLVGYVLIRRGQVAFSWLLFAAGMLLVHLLFLDSHPILRMLALIATTFTGMKVIAVAKSCQDKTLGLTFSRWAIFATGWVGMRAQPFETLGGPALPDAWPLIRYGVSRVVAGGLLILLARLVASCPADPWLVHVTVSVMLLIGLSLVLHFGLLSMSAGMWRLKGANTYLLFKQPARALSLTEFWSKRWNLAFSEMTAIAIFRPLKNKAGSGAALMLAFLFSGLLHELALSVPVNKGYGLPMLYFAIQGALVLLEKAMTLKKIKLLNHPVVARIWTFFWIVRPAPLLFHPAFIKLVVWPLVGLVY